MATLDFRLYVITDRRQCFGLRDLTKVVDEACQAGAKAIQLREKDLSAVQIFNMANELKEICRQNGAKLLINERADIVSALDADGVHLTAKGLPVHAVRKVLPANKIIGVSTHAFVEAKRAEQAGCDFILFGPIFRTPSKIRYGKPQGLRKLKELTERVTVPVFAVGGINPERAQECLEHGAAGVAVVSAIMAAHNAAELVYEYQRHLGTL